MILVVASEKDSASLNIRKQILENYDFEETAKMEDESTYEAQVNLKHIRLVTIKSESVKAQFLGHQFAEVDLVVFISRHSSMSGRPTLSVHTPGNLGDAQYGGIPREISISPANVMRETLRRMLKIKQEMELDYEVSYEGTHHGPSLNMPTMFAELGSSEDQWMDEEAADVVARATIEAISTFGDSPARVVLGIGGPHYNLKFTNLALEKCTAFGHIIPKYAVPYADERMLEKCIERTFEKVQAIVLDWKGIKGDDKPRLMSNIERTDLQIEKV